MWARFEWPGDPTLSGSSHSPIYAVARCLTRPSREILGLSFPALSGKSVQVDCFGICEWPTGFRGGTAPCEGVIRGDGGPRQTAHLSAPLPWILQLTTLMLP